MIFTDEPVPDKFFFFPGVQEILVCDGQKDTADIIRQSFSGHAPDYGILVDCSNPARTGGCRAVYESAQERMVIDHHFTSSCVEELCIVDTKACASGEIIYDLLSEMEKLSGKKILTLDIATSLIAAILADTGGFRYSNTNKEAFRIAFDLFSRFPIDLRHLTYHLFEKTSLSRIHLQGKAYEATRFYENNTIAACSITLGMIEQCGALEGDVDGICSDLKNIDGITVAFVLRERPNGEIRINIRSSEAFDASAFASLFGGGGHMRASGCSLYDMTLEQAHQLIVSKCIETIAQNKAANGG
jgi:phosphoesterase RecJ-like protein